MLLPTQDDKLKDTIRETLDDKFNDWDDSKCQECHALDEDNTCGIIGEVPEQVGFCPQIDESLLAIAELIAKQIEDLGYHKGLPTSIEEALNSGDGSYRP